MNQQLRRKLDHITNILWAGGVTNPVTYIEQISSILKVLHEGVRSSGPFYDTLEKLDLIESFVVDVQLNDGSEHRLSGFYTINEDRLRDLAADDLAMLHRRGYLEAIYMAIASMSQMPELVDRKNQRRQAPAGHAWTQFSQA